jgi:hypothetical protein
MWIDLIENGLCFLRESGLVTGRDLPDRIANANPGNKVKRIFQK